MPPMTGFLIHKRNDSASGSRLFLPDFVRAEPMSKGLARGVT